MTQTNGSPEFPGRFKELLKNLKLLNAYKDEKLIRRPGWGDIKYETEKMILMENSYAVCRSI